MTDKLFDVVGVGSAIVDVIARCDDALLAELCMDKGSMRLIGADDAEALYTRMGPGVETSGGSVSNTCAGVASFGGRAAFIGKVADDQLGAIFAHDIRSVGVHFDTRPATDASPTGRCLILVTPDGERTMNTYLGAAAELGLSEINGERIAESKLLYLEGYSFDPPLARAAFFEAAGLAKAAGTKVAVSLSDPFCVERHRDAFLDFIETRADLVFANERELLSLYETDDFEAACDRLRKAVGVGAVTRSAKGSRIVAGAETIEVAAAPVASVVDTTGAGDLYAAGFLFGYATGRDLAACGRLGSIAAAEVISHIGPRPLTPLSRLMA
ncbi:MAG: adenosine kinase [Hyphomicrobiales bacterium]|nr:adenosine kinase [Hyphomicrobiales bacterium]